MPFQPPSVPHPPAGPRPRRGLGLGLVVLLAALAGCEDLPLEVAVPTRPTATPAGSARPSGSPTVAPASASPGASATPTAGPTPSPVVEVSPSPSQAPFPSPTPVPSRTPAPSPTPTPSPTINPNAPARVKILEPLESADFSDDEIDIVIEAELPDDEAIVLEKLEVFYDGVLLSRQESADATMTVSGWNPHVVNSLDDEDLRPVPHGPHVLRAVATTEAGTVTSAEVTFDKPFLFRGWKTTLLKDGAEQPLPQLTPARSNMGLVAIQNRLFSWMGEAGANLLTELRMLHLDVFNPTWSTRTAPALEVRQRAGFVAVGDRIYLIGGEGLLPPNTLVVTADVQSYDVFFNRLDAAVPDLPETRSDAAVARLDRFIYVAGGYKDAGNANPQRTLYRLEVTEDGVPVGATWQRMADMPVDTARAGASMVAHGGKLYLFGGQTGPNAITEVALKYDPSSNTWNHEVIMPQGVTHAVATSLGDHIWLFGGDASTSAEKRVIANAFKYDPRRRAFTSTGLATNLPSARAGAGAAVVGGQLFLVGGYRYAADGSREFLSETLRADTL